MENGLSILVQQLLDKLVETGAEDALQVAVYVDGKLVVDAWAGVFDAGASATTGDTLFTSWSTTKGFAATCIHLLAEAGALDYETPVAACWPEFGCHGKEEITIGQVLTHTAGIPQMPANATPESITDWEAMCKAIAAHEPLWPPGTRTAYHALVFGWIVGEVVRRIDGRLIAQLAREELCAPLGIDDFYLGIADEAEGRVATLRDEEVSSNGEEASPNGASAPSPAAIRERAAPAHLMRAEVMNRPDVRRACYPGAGGIMNARAIARLYAMLGNGGSLDGRRLLSAERVEEISSLQTDAHDEVMGARVRKGLGFLLGGAADKGGDVRMGKSGGGFGHPGHGGSIGFADPSRRLALGITKSLMKSEADKTRSTAYLIAEAVREYIDGSFAD